MARVIDNNPTPFHSVGGTKLNDVIFGNGLGHMFGGDGNDVLNGAIIDLKVIMAGQYLLFYGGVGRFDVDGKRTIHPAEFTDHGKTGGLHHDGNDTLHGGIFNKMDGGSDADLYVIHGPAMRDSKLPPWLSAFNVREGDEFIFSDNRMDGRTTQGHKIGFDLLGSKFDWVDKDTIVLREVTLLGYDANPIVGEQKLRVTFDGEPGDWDGPRGHVSGKIMLDVTGKSQNDDIERWVAHHAGWENIDIAAGSDHFDQFIF